MSKENNDVFFGIENNKSVEPETVRLVKIHVDSINIKVSDTAEDELAVKFEKLLNTFIYKASNIAKKKIPNCKSIDPPHVHEAYDKLFTEKNSGSKLSSASLFISGILLGGTLIPLIEVIFSKRIISVPNTDSTYVSVIIVLFVLGLLFLTGSVVYNLTKNK